MSADLGDQYCICLQKYLQNPRYNFQCVAFSFPPPNPLHCCYYTFLSPYFFCDRGLVVRGSLALQKHPIHLAGELGYCYAKKLLSNVPFPSCNFCQLSMDSSSLVEKKHLFSAPSKAVWFLSGTSLLTLLWLEELGSEALRSRAVAGDNHSSVQV